VSARHVEHVMGMPVILALRGRHTTDDTAVTAWAAVMDSLREADRVFSTYRTDSAVSRLGRGELTLADCPPEVADVLALGERAEAESSGAFRVRRPELDPSAVVKGWAVERAARHLDALPATSYCLSAGGDMTSRTAMPDAPPWRIGIENPLDPHQIIAVVPVHTGAVATSGTAHRGRHIVDARTGLAPSGIASVTVVNRSLTVADIDATAAFAQGEDAARWLRTRPGDTGLVVWRDGATTITGGAAAEPRRVRLVSAERWLG
jgi:thiamine biosynthesis lipoprotein